MPPGNAGSPPLPPSYRSATEGPTETVSGIASQHHTHLLGTLRYRNGSTMADGEFVPYVPPEENLPELTVKAILLGVVLSMVMAAANAYLGLYAGMTVSATIPAAVIALAVFRALRKWEVVETATILETNLAKTMASAGESLAAGVIFTIPALLILGLWGDIDIAKTGIIALVGGCLGVLFTISLRRVLIVDLDLPYPEGVAATEVLKTGEEGGPGVHFVFVGLVTAMLYKFSSSEFGLSIFREKVEGVVRAGRARFYSGVNLSPALMSVGYIVGLRIASYIFLGGILGWFIIAPSIGIMQGWPDAPTDLDSYWILWGSKIRFVGVGAMVVGGVYSIYMMRSAITIT
ncbi:MAG TPA: oligopeptide transporter, OPT family [Thermoplasmata archaeon]|nr:oligopeptide transporter, OPT family [Thermoplasmata archaeon]